MLGLFEVVLMIYAFLTLERMLAFFVGLKAQSLESLTKVKIFKLLAVWSKKFIKKLLCPVQQSVFTL